MPKPPKSPSDTTSGHNRRPSTGRRTSSSDKIRKETAASSSSKHALKSSDHASTNKTQSKMSSSSIGAKAPPAAHDISLRDSRKQHTSEHQGSQTTHGASDVGIVMEDRRENENIPQSKAVTSPALAVPPGTTSQAEIERLRSAMNAKLLLNQQRDNLSKHLTERTAISLERPSPVSRTRFSPIHEEVGGLSPSLDAAFSSPLPTGMESASTESNKTIRGGTTPGNWSAPTPSYPFPPMRTASGLSWNSHRPFTALSPTVQPANFAGGRFDGPSERLLSGSVTPASTATFQPPGTSMDQDEEGGFQQPNLYDISLALSAEPGLEPWWSTICQTMKEVYKAERVTLSVPADATDIENVPWGQKATFNTTEEDHLSLTYLPRGSSLVPSSGDTNDTFNSDAQDESLERQQRLSVPSTSRPGLLSRHSFTAYEDSKREPKVPSDVSRPLQLRQPLLTRSQSYLSGRPDQVPRTNTLRNAELSLASLEEHLAYEDAKQDTFGGDDPRLKDPQGRVFQVLQALDYESDPLIDSSGVIRVLERGKVIVLTRDYPYLEDANAEDDVSGGSKTSKSSRSKDTMNENIKLKWPDPHGRASSLFGTKITRRNSGRIARSGGEKGKGSTSAPYMAEEEDEPSAHNYEEYEQAPPSPWAQSPAPSPAIRADPSENPFFADASIDEESFNPTTAPQDYSRPIEAIGIDRSCTVLHIPMIHPLLSKPAHAFRLDAAVMESKSPNLSKGKRHLNSVTYGKEAEEIKTKHSPIAILSIISSITPYPTNLRHSLQHLAPHLATSFSLCRHYSNLETEISGLSRKRPHISGFGAVDPTGRPVNTNLSSNTYQRPSHDHLGGSAVSISDSITSPSDYSGVSRSTGGSPAVTPGWGPDTMTGLDRAVHPSPGYIPGDSYFTSKSRAPAIKVDTTPGAGMTSGRRSSKDSSPVDTRHSLRGQGDERQAELSTIASEKGDSREEIPLPSPSKQSRLERDTAKKTLDKRDSSPPHASSESVSSARRQAIRGASAQNISRTGQGHVHTQLHSYGADFSSTFQSLPNTTTGGSMKVVPGAVGARSQVDMPPPSDRLKTLMLDTLPAHLFVALPQSGEIVWVNNRYLTYRGQTVSDLKEDPWGSIHPDELEGYLKEWSHALRTGEQFSMQVRIRRFDGSYRWFYTRAVGGRDTRGVIVQWYGSYMDIHDQHVAEVKAARQEEIETSEAKHRLLANLIPQIIFAATEEEGITFANEQWLSYTGQSFDDALGLGFMDFVHPEDLAKCRIPTDRPPTPTQAGKRPSRHSSETSSGAYDSEKSSNVSETPTETTVKGVHQSLSRQNSSSNGSVYELPSANLSDLANNGVIKITTDNTGRQSYTTEVRLKSNTGEYRWHLVRCVEVDNINFGSGDGSWFGACTDINDHKILEAALKDAMDSKSKFLSNMSHEIRTPLIGISGMVSFLQDTILTDEQSDYTNTIASSASSLLMIINDILDISKVDSGMMKLNFEWLHPSSLIEDVHELISTMAIQKGVELNYVVDEDVPAMVKGDKFRIRQVLLNVVGNAIKFTDVGEVFTSCKVYHDHGMELGPNEVMLIWSVIDTGSGFSDAQKQKMFKPFSQIDASLTRAHGGTGLGLVISRTLVELHGGHMDGQGMPDQGATFTFTIRVRRPSGEDQPPPPPLTPMPGKIPSRRPSFASAELAARAMKSAGGNPAMTHRFRPSPTEMSPRSDIGPISPAGTFGSSASSDPLLYSIRSQHTDRSSQSSFHTGLSHFVEAAHNSQSDLSSMKLAIPDKFSPIANSANENNILARISNNSSPNSEQRHFKPPMYSILIVCPQKHSREATARHIEMTLPKDIPHQITSLATADEAHAMIGGSSPVIFTHIILNLAKHEEILLLIEEIFVNISSPNTSVVILSDPIQRQNVIKSVPDYDYDQLSKDNRVNFIFKPVKPSRFAVIFDPDKERDMSTDRNRSNAQQQVATQKQNYIDAEKRLGGKGHKVLLVEDNLVNQKVLLKYLGKVGVEVELANDGTECTDMVFAKPHDFYALILVSIDPRTMSSRL